MDSNEQAQLCEQSLRAACEQAGVDVAQVQDTISLRVFLDEHGGVAVCPVDLTTGHRLISLRADRTFMDVAEVVQQHVAARPHIVVTKPRAQEPAAAGTKFGLPDKIFDRLPAISRIGQARRHGATLPGRHQGGALRPATAEEKEVMSRLSARSRLIYARSKGIVS